MAEVIQLLSYAAIICHKDELSSSLTWLEIVYSSVFWWSATRYMKVKRMKIKEILRRIWLLSANNIKPSESMCKQSIQVKLELNSALWQIIAAKILIATPSHIFGHYSSIIFFPPMSSMTQFTSLTFAQNYMLFHLNRKNPVKSVTFYVTRCIYYLGTI